MTPETWQDNVARDADHASTEPGPDDPGDDGTDAA